MTQAHKAGQSLYWCVLVSLLLLPVLLPGQVNFPACTPDSEFSGNCFSACLLCNLHDVRGQTSAIPVSRGDPDCLGASVNTYAFVAQSEQLTLDVSVGECSREQGGTDPDHGLAFYIFRVEPECITGRYGEEYVAISPCSGPGGAKADAEEWVLEGRTKRFTVTEPLVVGNLYFLAVGSQADAIECDYTFTVVEGDTDVTRAVPELTNTEESAYCIDRDYTFAVRDPIPGVVYTISVDGVPVGDTTARYAFTRTGEHRLAVAATYSCSGYRETDYILMVAAPATTAVTEVLCPGACYAAADGRTLCAPGEHTVRTTTARGGCDSIIQLSLVAGRPDTTELLANLCGGDTLAYAGKTYTAAGTYSRTLTNQYGCDSLVRLTVALDTCPVRGQVTATNVSCPGGRDGGLSFAATSGLAPYTYTYARLGGGPAGQGTLRARGTAATITDLPAGTYLVELTDALGGTGYLNATVREPASLVATFTAADYRGAALSCAGAADGRLTVAAAGGNAPYTYAWEEGATLTTGRILEDLAAGTYRVTVIDAAGCMLEDSAQLVAPPPLEVSADYLPETCAGPGTGRLTTAAATGGVGEYRYALLRDKAPASPVPASRYDSLAAGDYVLRVTDANGCTADTTFNILFPERPNLSLTATPRTVSLGEAVELRADLTSGSTLAWRDTALTGCADCRDVTLRPLETVTFVATARSMDGCMATDSLRVTVLDDRRVYLPSAFSPDGDGTNDRLRVYGGPAVEEILRLRVFDRWGSLLVELAEDEAAAGWDGKAGNRRAPLGAYLYTVEVRYLDGVVEVLRSSAMLIR